ncbi:Mo-dependent nitrogenase C-terminal domain-containing protein [Lyngbya aestuarii]|uniref:Mo-dependent nitrogenase C-terminal domain-containing protein n=1 Tax=Lyngbya aestuarii TaxID=118322 RepID=UPI00403DCD53
MYSFNTEQLNNNYSFDNQTSQTEYLSANLKPLRLNFDLLNPIRQWLDNIEINHPKVASSIAKLIPGQCPFARDICIFGRKIAQIPPLCKLNPFYEQLVCLRFRALCYLAEQGVEDISSYC